ncbi:MAG: hypothetical protein H6636_02065 [Anaerolineales bacterium]|nr:hypothetical protein [Anaerolineales bacterium]
MMKRYYTLLFLFLLPLAACAAPVVPTPTPSPILPTPEPTPIYVEAGGYYLPPLDGYDVQVNGTQLGLLNISKTLIISISGVTSPQRDEDPDAILTRYLAAIIADGNGSHEKGAAIPIQIDGKAGISAPITGTIYGFTFEGEAFVVPDTPQHFLFGFGISNLSKEPTNWETEGMTVFHALQDTIRFLTPSAAGCFLSMDETYGSLANPIKVGGGPLDGPTREDVYLSTLRAPTGDMLTYESMGATASGELDIFQIQGLEAPILLFIDKYNFESLRAPTGFSCASAFPLVAP